MTEYVPQLIDSTAKELHLSGGVIKSLSLEWSVLSLAWPEG